MNLTMIVYIPGILEPAVSILFPAGEGQDQAVADEVKFRENENADFTIYNWAVEVTDIPSLHQFSIN